MVLETVGDIGELELLRRLQPFCQGIGDDGAVLPRPEASLVVTTDVLVEGVHFSDRTTAPEDVGWRAVAANLSDLAAMGAVPLGITVGLALPGTVAVAWVEAVYRGMLACLGDYGGDILGGDVVRSSQVSLAITALGQGDPARMLYRDRAQPGQVIVATGAHGASRAGLELLLQPESGVGLVSGMRDRFIRSHQRPRPRFDAVAALHHCFPSGKGTALPVAAMDSSDGLANAVLHLCQASGVGARLVRSHLPFPPGLLSWVGPETALDWTLYGGEDFELVLALPPEIALALTQSLGPEAAIIGTVEAGEGVILLEQAEDGDGQPLPWENSFRHF
ncbi:thiamine-phosphate kinase [Leptolyngbya sp. PCC 6406]|uniref:thiamine-phosphate kinase n=1 Tax=Leptolyngbya sp. PCC 6406 TaxID=1173264 RepID=UPI0002AC7617|nr:thiamine-phosphate kinase [Leptolyngbya sp. PCC 6406]